MMKMNNIRVAIFQVMQFGDMSISKLPVGDFQVSTRFTICGNTIQYFSFKQIHNLLNTDNILIQVCSISSRQAFLSNLNSLRARLQQLVFLDQPTHPTILLSGSPAEGQYS